MTIEFQGGPLDGEVKWMHEDIREWFVLVPRSGGPIAGAKQCAYRWRGVVRGLTRIFEWEGEINR